MNNDDQLFSATISYFIFKHPKNAMKPRFYHLVLYDLEFEKVPHYCDMATLSSQVYNNMVLRK